MVTSAEFLSCKEMSWLEKLFEIMVLLGHELEKEGITMPALLFQSQKERLEVEEKMRVSSQPLIDSYKQWGQFGWTPIPYAPPSMFFCCPNTIEEADETALQYCSEANMEKLFDALRIQFSSSPQKVEDSIGCYKNRFYNPCVLSLFPLIESSIVNVFMRDEEGKIYCGTKKVLTNYFTGAKAQSFFIHTLFIHSEIINIEECLTKQFRFADNFATADESLINRNRVSHGQSNRESGEADCIKLFLVLYNVRNLLKKFPDTEKLMLLDKKPKQTKQKQPVIFRNKTVMDKLCN